MGECGNRLSTRRSTRAGGVWTVLLASVLLAQGCGPGVRSLSVEVRDAATKEPAAGVTVIADVPNRNHPFSIASLLGQTGEVSTRAVTDQRGRAELSAIQGRPVRISVLAPGWSVGCVECDEDGAWTDSPEPAAVGVRRVSVRCQNPGSAR